MSLFLSFFIFIGIQYSHAAEGLYKPAESTTNPALTTGTLFCGLL